MRILRPPEAFIVPKHGVRELFCEDQAGSRASDDGWVMAVSDGATQSVLAREWAEVLVERFLAAPVEALDQEWVDPAQVQYAQRLQKRIPSMSWHQLARLQQSGGAYATLLGVTVAGGEVRWLSAGDSLLVVVSGESLALFPPTTAAALDADPWLISTMPERNLSLWPHVQQGAFRLPPGESRLMLITDAVARWLLSQDTAAAARRLCGIGSPAAFAALIAAARDQEGMKDDDCTLLALEVEVEVAVAAVLPEQDGEVTDPCFRLSLQTGALPFSPEEEEEYTVEIIDEEEGGAEGAAQDGEGGDGMPDAG